MMSVPQVKESVIRAGMTDAEVNAVLRNTSTGSSLKDMAAADQKRHVMAQKVREALKEKFPWFSKTVTIIAVLSIVGKGVAMANANTKPETIAAWNTFSQEYRNILQRLDNKQPVTRGEWWTMINALNNYLDKSEVGPAERGLLTRELFLRIGPPDNELFPRSDGATRTGSYVISNVGSVMRILQNYSLDYDPETDDIDEALDIAFILMSSEKYPAEDRAGLLDLKLYVKEGVKKP